MIVARLAAAALPEARIADAHAQLVDARVDEAAHELGRERDVGEVQENLHPRALLRALAAENAPAVHVVAVVEGAPDHAGGKPPQARPAK